MAFWAREKLLPHIGVRRVESSQESARDPGLSVAGAAGEQAAATTKSLHWTATTSSKERMSDTFAVFTRKLLRVSKRYPNAAALIPSMQKRLQEVLLCKGGMTKF